MSFFEGTRYISSLPAEKGVECENPGTQARELDPQAGRSDKESARGLFEKVSCRPECDGLY